MITTSDIVDILYKDFSSFGKEIYRKGNIPSGVVKKERVVILPKDQTPETYWKKSFVEVNICVPDLKEGVANLSRLQEIERRVVAECSSRVGEFKDSHYSYGISSVTGLNKDSDMKCHYVNVRLFFEVLIVNEI